MKLLIMTTKGVEDAIVVGVREWEKKPLVVLDIWNYHSIMTVDVKNDYANDLKCVWLNFDSE